jgi:hypothetical protein
MRDQFAHLISMSGLPNVELRILPFASPAYAPLGRPVAILDFPEPGDPGMAYFDLLGRGVYVDDEAQISVYRQTFELLAGAALSVEETVRRLADRG